MPFCANCGAPVEGRFCAKCGAAAPGEPAAAPASAPAAGGAALSENVASALCYLVGLITGILFLVLAPYNQNKTVRFHAFQSIFLHVAWIVLVIVETIVGAALPFFLGLLATLLYLVVFIGGLILWIYMMWTAYNSRRVKLPVIGDLAEKQA